MSATTDFTKADFIVVFDGCKEKVPNERAIYVGQHPYVGNGLSPSFRTFNDKKCLRAIRLDRDLNCGEWWIDYTYDQLVSMQPTKKEKEICCIMTYKNINSMYMQRVLYMQQLSNYLLNKNYYYLDIYGRPEENFRNDSKLKVFYRGFLGANNPNGLLNEHTIGKNIISKYRYSLEFDVGPTKNFISERFYDAILLWTMPIYFGSTNVDFYINKDSFVYTDIYNIKDAEFEKIRKLVESSYREENLHAISETRDLLLNKYQTWPYIYNVLKEYV